MKKLLFVATASLCATVFGAIESSNVVGYQNKATVGGFNFVTPTFKNVSGGNIDIQDIKLSGDGVVDYGDNIQILDEGGATQTYYNWVTGMGWVDLNLMTPATATITPGAGILISTMQDGVVVTFSGAVSKDDLVTTSVSGFNFVGNSTPSPISIQDITISGEAVTDYGDNIQFLDIGGATETFYNWISGMGWVDLNTFEPATETLQPGDGVLISTMNAGVVITVPSAL